MFVDFFWTLDKVLYNEVCLNARRADAGNYCYRFMSLRGIIDKASSRLPLNTPTTWEIYLALKLTTNNRREELNNRLRTRFNMKRTFQSHDLVKENKHTHYANVQAMLVKN